MGRGEQPSLMMDPANCSPVQVSGTWYLLPKMKKKTTTPNYCHILSWWQLCVCVSDVTVRGGSIIHLQSRRDAGSGCVPALSPPLSSWDRGVGDASGCLCPSSEIPKGANCSSIPQKCTQTDPGADVPPWCRVASSGTLLPFLMPFWLQVLAEITSRCSGQVRH